MSDEAVKLTKKLSVPDYNGCTNFGGIATDGTKIWCIKTYKGETKSVIYEFDSIKATTPSRHTIENCGHGNGLTYYNGYLYIPCWGETKNHKYLKRINVKDWTTKNISGPFAPSNITYWKDGLFLIRKSWSSTAHTTATVAVVKVTSTAFSVVRTFYIKNPKAASGYKIGQDIGFCNGQLMIPVTTSNVLKSAILCFNIGEAVSGKTYSPSTVLLTSNTSKWEVETMCALPDKSLLLGMNTSADGVYYVEGTKVDTKGETKGEDNNMVFNIVAGHSKSAPGASGYINEVTEDRKVKDHLIRVLRQNGCTVYDCTSDGPTKSTVLQEQVQNCNKHAGIDVHIHFNAGTNDPDRNTTGTEVFVYSKASKCKTQATAVCKNIAGLGLKNRGLKYSTGLYVLRNSKNPAMLIEVCFVDDKDDCRVYTSAGAEVVARQIAHGLLGRDVSGNPEPPKIEDVGSSYIFRILTDATIYDLANPNSTIKGVVKAGSAYTIIEEIELDGVKYGKLKSGAGWIDLSKGEKV